MKPVFGIAALLAFTAPAAAASFTLPAADIASGMQPH